MQMLDRAALLLALSALASCSCRPTSCAAAAKPPAAWLRQGAARVPRPTGGGDGADRQPAGQRGRHDRRPAPPRARCGGGGPAAAGRGGRARPAGRGAGGHARARGAAWSAHGVRGQPGARAARHRHRRARLRHHAPAASSARRRGAAQLLEARPPEHRRTPACAWREVVEVLLAWEPGKRAEVSVTTRLHRDAG